MKKIGQEKLSSVGSGEGDGEGDGGVQRGVNLGQRGEASGNYFVMGRS
jgi:hypothetical protein